ncbi:ABC transporter permease [Pseudochryseolinea flava]|uniref:ABC transporter permease n=2 Tax=Pseudochryseolinea flava TaxID=2059302 RepID=A0A364Y1D9_9BACT|nr:ABC transporter permease [Pseudochryseolinea flava]
MIGSYIKTSGRSIVRNKMFSTINIFGLAISMSVGLLLIAFLADLNSYDRIHTKGDRIYRLIDTHVNKHHGKSIELASTSVVAPRRIKEEYAGIEDLVLMRSGFGGDAEVNDKVVPIEGIWSDDSFFNVFSFKLLKGNPRTALKAPFSIVLTEKEANRVFGDDDPMGKTIRMKDDSEKGFSEYLVTGLMEDPPKFSHIRFGALASFATLDILKKNEEYFLEWQNVWSNYAYIVLPEKSSTEDLQSYLDNLAKTENEKMPDVSITFTLQPFFDIALGKDLSNQLGPTMLSSVMWIVSALAVVVILSACFNYTNLSIARSMRRSREVGIRKVIGALRSHVLAQFIAEAVIISFLALVLSFGIFLILRPAFLSLSSELSNLVTLDLTPSVVGYFILLAVIVGLVAGILPALFFAKIKAVQVLKDVSSIKVFKNVAVRRLLIVAQYTLSLAFIATTMIGYEQYKYFIAFDLGYKTDNILNIRLQGNNPDVVSKAMQEIPEVSRISRSIMVTSTGSYYGNMIKYQGDSVDISYNTIDEHYLPIHGHKFLAGTNFRYQQKGVVEHQAIVNEKLVSRLKMGTPDQAVGERFQIDTVNYRIVGVLKDFHYGKVDSKIDPFIFKYSNEDVSYLNASISSKDWIATMEKVEEAWKKVDPIHALDAKFYSDKIQESYNQFQVMVKVIGFLAVLAITIASMGLLGMVVFTTETRTKEISIRKVLGASEGSLIYLLSRGFILLLLVSAVIALPLTYLLFTNVILREFVYTAPIGMFELFGGLVGILIIAMIMIGSQTIRVARANPASVLKSE